MLLASGDSAWIKARWQPITDGQPFALDAGLRDGLARKQLLQRLPPQFGVAFTVTDLGKADDALGVGNAQGVACREPLCNVGINAQRDGERKLELASKFAGCLRRPAVRGDNKVAWGLAIVCLPYVGALLYGYMGAASFLPRTPCSVSTLTGTARSIADRRPAKRTQDRS